MATMLSFKREFGLIIVGAIIFIASFMWKDLFSEIREIYFPKQYGMTGRVFFTILVTIILVFVAVFLKDGLQLSDNHQVNRITFDSDPINNNNLSDNHDISDNHDF